LVIVIETAASWRGLTVIHCWRGLTAIPARTSPGYAKKTDVTNIAAHQGAKFGFLPILNSFSFLTIQQENYSQKNYRLSAPADPD
jgi:hypothetical protein